MRTGKWRDRAIAWGVVLAWHACVGWWLLHVVRVAVAPERALQVVYVDLPPARLPPPPAKPSPPRRATRAATGRASRSPRTSALTVVSTAAAPPALPVAALLEQARAQAVREVPIDFSRHDPLGERPLQLAAEPDGRFRMQPQRSLQAMVATVGGYLLAPKGYDPDPCPRHRANVGNLMAAGDSAALRQELESMRRHCQP